MTLERGGWLVALACTGAWGCAPPLEPVTPSEQPAAVVGAPAQVEGRQKPAEPNPATPTPAPTEPAVDELTGDMIRDVVRANYDKMAACYQGGLTRDPAMKGTIEVSLAIDGDGSVVDAKVPAAASEIRDADVVSCVEGEFRRLRFPASKRGMVNMVYPIVFAVQ